MASVNLQKAAGSALGPIQKMDSATIMCVPKRSHGIKTEVFTAELFSQTSCYGVPYATVVFDCDERNNIGEVRTLQGEQVFRLCGEMNEWRHLILKYPNTNGSFGQIVYNNILDHNQNTIMRYVQQRVHGRESFVVERKKVQSSVLAIIDVDDNAKFGIKLPAFLAVCRRNSIWKALILTAAFRLAQIFLSRTRQYMHLDLVELTFSRTRIGSATSNFISLSTHPRLQTAVQQIHSVRDFMIKKVAKARNKNSFVVANTENITPVYILERNQMACSMKIIDLRTDCLLATMVLSPTHNKYKIFQGKDNLIGYIKDLKVFNFDNHILMAAFHQRNSDEEISGNSYFIVYCTQSDRAVEQTEPIAFITFNRVQGYARAQTINSIGVINRFLVLCLAIHVGYIHYRIHLDWVPTINESFAWALANAIQTSLQPLTVPERNLAGCKVAPSLHSLHSGVTSVEVRCTTFQSKKFYHIANVRTKEMLYELECCTKGKMRLTSVQSDSSKKGLIQVVNIKNHSEPALIFVNDTWVGYILKEVVRLVNGMRSLTFIHQSDSRFLIYKPRESNCYGEVTRQGFAPFITVRMCNGLNEINKLTILVFAICCDQLWFHIRNSPDIILSRSVRAMITSQLSG